MKAKLLIALILLIIFSPQTFAYAGEANLAAVIQRNWSQWHDKQDNISYAQVVAQLECPYTGDDAAALVALAQYFRKNRINYSLNMDSVLKMAERPILQEGYQKELQSLAQASHELYASGQPNFSVLKQGPIGDCFFFSGIGWLANYRPQVLMNAITPLSDGRYKVVFPNNLQVVVNRPTDAEMLFFNSSSTISDGLWVTILEKAVGAILPNYTKRVVNEEEPAYNLALGGAPATIERIWTAKTPNVVYLHNSSYAEVRRILVMMQKKQLMSQALTGKRPPTPSIAGNHVYAIMGFDDQHDVVTLWNPWGDEFSPLPGHSGFPRKHGVFHLSLKEFCAFYEVLFVE
ncbi:C2 family cysteine protease [uncultured Anaeromusa sp.]|uniref:C2 family cysteine protease n=1 Tax=uncultured Anaeromusa sp. TaxID=673273 RepID=UPI0029C860F9|nr:C2 family cysteine protease [uncultured Anaeromusa sp.]